MTRVADSPAISVVMAAYNGSGYIAQTIASVLAQSFTDFELIVVDDASTDDTLAQLRTMADPRVIVIASPANGGPVVARNRAFAAARGRYIVGLDQDDLCHPGRFAAQSAYLDAHPGTVLVASAIDLLEAGSIRAHHGPVHTTPALIDWRLQFGNPLAWSSVMFRADIVRAMPEFERPERLYAEDFDFYHRIAPFGAIARIDTALISYRLHPGGASQRYTAKMIASAAQVLATAYAPLFGAQAEATARLVVTHFSDGAPVPDRPTLERLGVIVEAVHQGFCATRAPGAADLAAIMDEYARLWWRMVDASVRSGALSPVAVKTACPPALRRHPRSPRRVASSALIGSMRAMLSRWKAFAL
ncbi:glycosyltransferase family 2 protein [Novosphingobium sp.]|uniref:glycosyltransferase family 2 protein n=1 Tax=Novosphingobium sp. TaxID=1874826 RepID=UPI003B52C8E3